MSGWLQGWDGSDITGSNSKCFVTVNEQSASSQHSCYIISQMCTWQISHYSQKAYIDINFVNYCQNYTEITISKQAIGIRYFSWFNCTGDSAILMWIK